MDTNITMKSLYVFLKQRFPIFPLLIFSILTISGISTKIQPYTNNAKVILLAFIYTGFLFHLRILDEFKDYEYDSRYHPDRPVQSGEISLKQIKIFGIINLAIMLAASLIASSLKLISLLIFVIFYSFVMFKEFFIKNFYEKSPVLYLISHQVVFIPLYLYLYSSLNSSFWPITDLEKLSLFCYSLTPVILIEIGRKMNYRFDKEGKKTNDTYLFVWGERRTISTFSILLILSGMFSFYIQNFRWLLSILILISGLVIFIGGFLFPKKIIKLNMVITFISVLSLPALLLI